jgi:hypothetical protein
MLGGVELSGWRPISQPLALREILAAAVILVAWLILSDWAGRLVQPFPIRRIAAFFRPADNRFVLPVMFLFAVGYLAVFAYRAPRGYLDDRYALPLIPCFAIPLLRAMDRNRELARLPLILAYAALGAWSLYGIAATRDLHALAQARRDAVDRLLSSGVRDTAIACGYEYDGWTQLIHQGHLNLVGINSPAGSYDPSQGLTPCLKCLYRVEFSPAGDTIPSAYGWVDYQSWLPPLHRRIYIDRFRNPSWFDPASTVRPPPEYEDLHIN